MKVWVRGCAEPIDQEFAPETDIKGVERMLAKYVL